MPIGVTWTSITIGTKILSGSIGLVDELPNTGLSRTMKEIRP
jgi:hypothetical protein